MSKSILDGIKTTWNTNEGTHMAWGVYPVSRSMEIVGNCPACGAPIYGHKTTSEEVPPIRYTCDCKAATKAFRMETK